MKQRLSFFGRNKITITIVIVLLGGGVYYFQSSSTKSSPTKSVQMAEVKKGDIRSVVTGSGQVYAEEQVDLQAVAAGDAIEVMSVAVKNDQEVKKDDLIMTLDFEEAKKDVRDAELALWTANIKMSQTKDLNKHQTKKERENRQLQEISLREAENRLVDAKESLQDYFIRAPFDGVVTGFQ